MSKLQKRLTGLFRKKKPSRFPTIALIGIGILAIATSGYLLLATPAFTPDAEDIFPGQGLTFFAELDRADCTDIFTRKAPNVCKMREDFLNSFIGESPERLSTFSDQVAIASYLNLSSDSTVTKPYVIALRVTNLRQAEHYLRSLSGYSSATESDANGVKVLRFTEPVSRDVYFWKGWLFFDADPLFLNHLAARQEAELPTARESQLFTAVDGRIPPQANIRILADIQGLSDRLPKSAAPLIDFIPQIGIAVSEKTERLEINIAADSPVLPSPGVFSKSDEDAFQKLISALPSSDTAVFGAVRNFKQGLDFALDYLENTDPAFALNVRGEAEKSLSRFFGNEISLENDILPLLENEIAFTVSAAETNSPYSVVIATDTKDRAFAEAKQEKLITALKNTAAVFVPRILEHQLDDGTIVREVAACDECVERETETVGNATLDRFVATDQENRKLNLALGLVGNFLVAANDEAKAKLFLESHQKLGQKTPLFLLELEDIKNQDEIIVIKPSIFQTFFPQVAERLADFDTIVAARDMEDSKWKLNIQANYAVKE